MTHDMSINITVAGSPFTLIGMTADEDSLAIILEHEDGKCTTVTNKSDEDHYWRQTIRDLNEMEAELALIAPSREDEGGSSSAARVHWLARQDLAKRRVVLLEEMRDKGILADLTTTKISTSASSRTTLEEAVR